MFPCGPTGACSLLLSYLCGACWPASVGSCRQPTGAYTAVDSCYEHGAGSLFCTLISTFGALFMAGMAVLLGRDYP